jgi:hypothetical protein
MSQEGGTAKPSSGATIVHFSDIVVSPPSVILLDANAVLDLFAHEAAMGGKSEPAFPAKKHSALVGCLNRLVSKGTKVVTTPAVLEEVFHVLWLRVLKGYKAKWTCSQCATARSDKDVRRHHPSDFATARAATLAIFLRAVAAAKKHGAKISLSAGDSSGAGQKVFDAFVITLKKHDAVGGKDALHVATAALLECGAIVTRDEGFRDIPQLTIYCP